MCEKVKINHYYTSFEIQPLINGTGSIGMSNRNFQQMRALSIYGNNLLLGSDIKLKENIRSINSPMETVSKLNAYMYDLKPVSIERGIPESYSANNDINKNKMGFMAHELLEVLPEIVKYEEEIDQYYVDYISVIPLLVEALKEQQASIEALEARIEKLEGSSAATKSATIGNTTSTNENPLANTPTLAQNIPNPFTDNTRIGITLPETVKTARLYVYNMQGVQIKSLNINERGNTSVTIEGYTLQAGMYLYNLIADGKEVDTKKMILTK
jgi:hypothetical protein